MSPPVTYLPAYLGLFASLVLALTCNAYLDIQYGSFGTEVLVWSGIFGYTLWVAWQQRGEVDDGGLFQQKVGFVIGILAMFLFFMPIWGMPRAGLFLLASLQAATNCVTVNRRKFMLALLASAVMVMFATTHYRADWTMLFYLVPYLGAVVFTLVAEQVSRRSRELQPEILGLQSASGQGLAIFSATLTILFVATALYALTPQMTRISWNSKYGQASNIGVLTGKNHGANAGKLHDGGTGSQGKSEQADGAGGHAGPGDQDLGNGEAGTSVGEGYREDEPYLNAWPSLDEMREAAKRPGMPRWQSMGIEEIVMLTERVQRTVSPLQKLLNEYGQTCKQWLRLNRDMLIRILFSLIFLALLVAAWVLFRETRSGLWLRMHWDFLWFSVLSRNSGKATAQQYFRALERLFVFHHVEREGHTNTREYLAHLLRIHGNLRHEIEELIALFEADRYGAKPLTQPQRQRMQTLYVYCYRAL